MIGLMDKMIATAIDECDVTDDLAFIQAIYVAQRSGGFPGYASAICDGLLKKRDAAIRAECFDKVKPILAGIDKQETDDPDGWWSTSVGAEFGGRILAELRAAIMGEEGR